MSTSLSTAPRSDDADAPVTPAAETGTHEVGREARVARIIHPDLFGRARAKQFPISALGRWSDGVAYSKMSVAEDLLGVPVDEADFPELAGHPDLYAVPDMSTAVVPPWEPDSVWVLADLYERGAPSALCSRAQLTTAHERLRSDLGLGAQSAGEPEFYLFTSDADGRPQPYSNEGVSYTVGASADPRGVVGRMHRSLIDFGIGVSAVNREFSPGQFEINVDHREALASADQIFLLKTAIKELAIGEGMKAVFMAKPLTEEEGSSLHVHMSLWRGDTNAFVGNDGSRSDLLLAAIAGLQAHAAGLLAFAAPTVNSYKRVAGNGLSPKTSSFGEDDRHAFARIPAEGGSSTRFELRAGDASASPYLLTAAILHAVRDGINRSLVPTAGGTTLPRSLSQSIDALENDEVLVDGFGGEFVSIYSELKRREVAAHARTVTDWEWNLYHSHA